MTEQARGVPPRIALLTCRHHDHIDHASEGKLMQELVRQGAAVTLVAWDDLSLLLDDSPLATHEQAIADVDDIADLVVLRTTWDYWHQLPTFRAFIEAFIPRRELANEPGTVLANLDKTYLRVLHSAGVPTVPTIFVANGDEATAIEHAKRHAWAPLIIKPTVGAAAVGLRKFDHPGAAALEYLRELTKTGGALLQPYLPRITTQGETSLVYFDNTFSHAVAKLPAPGDFRSQVDFGGVYTLVEPTQAQLHVAELALAAWESKYGDKPLYARVDLVPGPDGEPLLGELELVEPELFLDMEGHAAEMFASAILARVEQSRNKNRRSYVWTIAGVGVLVAVLMVFSVGVGVIWGWIAGWLCGGP